MTERKKARKMFSRVAVHLGKAKWKLNFDKTIQTARSGENEQAPFSENVF